MHVRPMCPEDVSITAAGLAFWSRYVESLIAQEIAAGVPSQRILVGGFSQGALWHVQLLTCTVLHFCPRKDETV